MKFFYIILITIFCVSAQAKVICKVETGNAVDQIRSNKTITINNDALVEVKGETLLATVQHIDGKLAQMMIEDTQNYTFSQLDQKDLVEQGHGNFTFQNIKNNGEYIALNCKVIN